MEIPIFTHIIIGQVRVISWDVSKSRLKHDGNVEALAAVEL